MSNLEKRKDLMIQVLRNWSDFEGNKVYSQLLSKFYFDINNCWYAKDFLPEDCLQDRIDTSGRNWGKVLVAGANLDNFAPPIREVVSMYPKLFWIKGKKIYCKFPKGVRKF